jgi:dimethylamine monooxygenase subunit B
MIHGASIQTVVKEIEQVTPKVKRFILASADGRELPRFSGGAHILTRVGDGEQVWQRPYSLCGDPHNRAVYQIAIRLQKNSLGGSVFWHRQVRKGQKVTISWPHNHFLMSHRAKHHVFFAAGIGITPFLPMMADAEERGETFELHYTAPTREQCAFYDEIQSRYGGSCRFYFSQEGERMQPDVMKDQSIGTHVYFCGPPAMVEAYRKAALSYGYPRKSIHYELFTSPAVEDAKPFEVELRHSGKTLQVPAEKTLLEVLLNSGVEIPFACRVGRCGTCAVGVAAGEVEHRDVILSDGEKKRKIVSCVSRSTSTKLVLDF